MLLAAFARIIRLFKFPYPADAFDKTFYPRRRASRSVRVRLNHPWSNSIQDLNLGIRTGLPKQTIRILLHIFAGQRVYLTSLMSVNTPPHRARWDPSTFLRRNYFRLNWALKCALVVGLCKFRAHQLKAGNKWNPFRARDFGDKEKIVTCGNDLLSERLEEFPTTINIGDDDNSSYVDTYIP